MTPNSIFLDGQWREWIHTPPPHGTVIQVERDEWAEPVTILRDEVSPYMNVCGLMWRLTALGRYQLGGMAQVQPLAGGRDGK